MSSRNIYLKPDERKAALSLYRSLKRAEGLIQNGERRSERILEEMRKVLLSEPLVKIDYIQVCNANTLEDADEIEGDLVIALAAYVGQVRLIDNLLR